MKKAMALFLLGLFSSCADTGYQPHYIISDTFSQETPQEEVR